MLSKYLSSVVFSSLVVCWQKNGFPAVKNEHWVLEEHMSGQRIHTWLSRTLNSVRSAMLLYYPISCHWWALFRCGYRLVTIKRNTGFFFFSWVFCFTLHMLNQETSVSTGIYTKLKKAQKNKLVTESSVQSKDLDLIFYTLLPLILACLRLVTDTS